MPAETAAAMCCLIFGGVLERFPKLKFCFAHGGNVFVIYMKELESGNNIAAIIYNEQSFVFSN